MEALRAAEVTNASVTATFVVAPATRLAAAMVMDTAVGVVRAMMPLGAPTDKAVSVPVVTVMPVVKPMVPAPMVIPASVMVKGVPAGMSATAVVITKRWFTVSCVVVAVKAATDEVPAALAEGCWDAKNPAG